MANCFENEMKSKRILRLNQVLDLFPVSKSTWWNGVKQGRYPKSVKLGPRTTGWLERDVLDLIDRIYSTRQ